MTPRTMYKENCTVLENKKVALGHWVLQLRSRDIAKTARPGQFVQVLCADGSYDPLLPRPFSFLSAKNDVFSILYHVVGKGTEFLSKIEKGDTLRVLGPLGNGFSQRPATSDQRPAIKILVGGGVGIPPLYHLAEMLIKDRTANKEKIHVFLGARNKSLLLCEKDFGKLGVKIHPATDDGTRGYQGLITEPLDKFLQSLVSSRSSQIYTCGPTPMLKAVSVLAEKFKVPCEVSVEVPMACGFGACLGCAVKVRPATRDQRPAAKIASRQSLVSSGSSQEYRFAIACTEGPVFRASDLLWD